jgi:hypothetical protein
MKTKIKFYLFLVLILISNISIASPPVNDDCSGAILLTVSTSCSNTLGDAAGATQSLVGCVGTANDDVWYKFVANSTDPVIDVISTSTSFQPVIELFDGCGGTSLICRKAIGTSNFSRIKGSGLTNGTTYYLRVYDWFSAVAAVTTFNICIYNVSAAANDECTGAVTLTSGTTCSKTFGDNVGGSLSLPSCNGSYISSDIWYKFVATANRQTIEISDQQNYFFNNIQVYDGCGGTSLVCSNLNITNLTALTIGNTYYIRVWNDLPYIGAFSTFSICVYEMPPSPVNDDCANAISLTVYNSSTLTSGNNMWATQSLPGCIGNADDDVWYKFTAITTHDAMFIYSDFDAVLEAFDGCGGSSLGCANLTSNGHTESITLSGAIPGHTYYFRVYDTGGGYSSTPTFDVGVIKGTINAVEESNFNNAGINLFPNPASQTLNIHSIYTIENIKIIDILGNEIRNLTSSGNTQLDISSLPKGLYNFVITTDKGIGNKKVSVQ